MYSKTTIGPVRTYHVQHRLQLDQCGYIMYSTGYNWTSADISRRAQATIGPVRTYHVQHRLHLDQCGNIMYSIGYNWTSAEISCTAQATIGPVRTYHVQHRLQLDQCGHIMYSTGYNWTSADISCTAQATIGPVRTKIKLTQETCNVAQTPNFFKILPDVSDTQTRYSHSLFKYDSIFFGLRCAT